MCHSYFYAKYILHCRLYQWQAPKTKGDISTAQNLILEFMGRNICQKLTFVRKLSPTICPQIQHIQSRIKYYEQRLDGWMDIVPARHNEEKSENNNTLLLLCDWKIKMNIFASKTLMILTDRQVYFQRLNLLGRLFAKWPRVTEHNYSFSLLMSTWLSLIRMWEIQVMVIYRQKPRYSCSRDVSAV